MSPPSRQLGFSTELPLGHVFHPREPRKQQVRVLVNVLASTSAAGKSESRAQSRRRVADALFGGGPPPKAAAEHRGMPCGEYLSISGGKNSRVTRGDFSFSPSRRAVGVEDVAGGASPRAAQTEHHDEYGNKNANISSPSRSRREQQRQARLDSDLDAYRSRGRQKRLQFSDKTKDTRPFLSRRTNATACCRRPHSRKPPLWWTEEARNDGGGPVTIMSSGPRCGMLKNNFPICSPRSGSIASGRSSSSYTGKLKSFRLPDAPDIISSPQQRSCTTAPLGLGGATYAARSRLRPATIAGVVSSTETSSPAAPHGGDDRVDRVHVDLDVHRGDGKRLLDFPVSTTRGGAGFQVAEVPRFAVDTLAPRPEDYTLDAPAPVDHDTLAPRRPEEYTLAPRRRPEDYVVHEVPREEGLGVGVSPGRAAVEVLGGQHAHAPRPPQQKKNEGADLAWIRPPLREEVQVRDSAAFVERAGSLGRSWCTPYRSGYGRARCTIFTPSTPTAGLSAGINFSIKAPEADDATQPHGRNEEFAFGKMNAQKVEQHTSEVLDQNPVPVVPVPVGQKYKTRDLLREMGFAFDEESEAASSTSQSTDPPRRGSHHDVSPWAKSEDGRLIYSL